MACAVFFWNSKFLLELKSEPSAIEEVCKSKIAEICAILQRDYKQLIFEKFCPETMSFEKTELQNFEDGDKINIILKTSLQNGLNKELNDKLFNKLKVLIKITSNQELDDNDRKYIYDFFQEHAECCKEVGTGKLSSKRKLNGITHDSIGSVRKSPRKKQKVSNKLTQPNCLIQLDFKSLEKQAIDSFSKDPKDPAFKELFKMLFPQRRCYIVSEKPPKVQQVKSRYPYLFTLEQVFTEFELIAKKQNMFQRFKENVEKFSCVIMRLTSCFENRHVSYMVKNAKEEDRTNFMHHGSLLMLPKYMNEGRYGILLLKNESSPRSSVSFPYIKANGDISSCLKPNSKFTIVVEGVTLCETQNLIEAVFGLMAAYYIFNAVYPDTCWKTFGLLERLYTEYAPDPEHLGDAEEEKIEFLKKYSLFVDKEKNNLANDVEE